MITNTNTTLVLLNITLIIIMNLNHDAICLIYYLKQITSGNLLKHMLLRILMIIVSSIMNQGTILIVMMNSLRREYHNDPNYAMI